MEVKATDMSGKTAGAPAASNAQKEMTVSHIAEQMPGEDSTVTLAQLKQMVEQMQVQLDSMNVGLQYSFYGTRDEKVAVKVVNRETGEVIREVPSREMQALSVKMSELVGMIFNDNA